MSWEVKKGERVGLVGELPDATLRDTSPLYTIIFKPVSIVRTRMGLLCCIMHSQCHCSRRGAPGALRRGEWRRENDAAADHHGRAHARQRRRAQGAAQHEDRLPDAGV